MRSCLVAEETYNEMIEWGAVPQIARAVLPTCLKVEMVATANLREWMHIIRLRTARAAHPQIREVAGMIRAILADKLPAIFEANLKEVD
jgi:thymidylate synthase (FAD)